MDARIDLSTISARVVSPSRFDSSRIRVLRRLQFDEQRSIRGTTRQEMLTLRSITVVCIYCEQRMMNDLLIVCQIPLPFDYLIANLADKRVGIVPNEVARHCEKRN